MNDMKFNEPVASFEAELNVNDQAFIKAEMNANNQSFDTDLRVRDVSVIKGEPGGYYEPSVKQTSENTVEFFFSASKEDMVAVRSHSITLPAGKDGQDGNDGQDGYTPQKNVDYFDGEDGTSVSVISVSESKEDDGNNIVTFSDGNTVTIKNGKTGKDGKDGRDGNDGNDGVSPVVSVSAITGGHRISITDKNSTKTVDVLDGSNGTTPVKGTDYWTSADKTEMVNSVLAALPTWKGGSY